MKNEPMIICPHCHEEILLTETLAGPMLVQVKKEYEKQLHQMADTMEAQETLLRSKIAAEEAGKARVAAEKESKSREEALRQELDEAKEVRLRLAVDLDEAAAKLATAQSTQAEAMKKMRALDEAKREMDITIETRISEQLETTRFTARKEAEDAARLKVAEKEQTITSMQTIIAELKQKAEQGSNQIQGEVQELELEKVLRAKFLHDVIAPVPKGINGADCIQEVKDSTGKLCGTVIWESKRTKAWSDGWLVKLREDQRAAKSDIAILVTQTLPKDVTGFDIIDGVWVCKLDLIIPIATLLRQSLIEVTLARGAGEGQASKMEILYGYMTGLKFKQRVQAIVEAFTGMQEDLLKEKKAVTKSWAKREEQLSNVMTSTVGMYGDIQGIAGKAVKEIEGLEMKAITNETEE